MEETIELKEIIALLLKGKWIISGITALFLVVATILSYFIISPVYEAKVTVTINNSFVDGKVLAGTSSYVDKVLTPALLQERLQVESTFEEVIEQSKLSNYTAKELKGNLSVEQVPNTNLFKLTMKADSSIDSEKLLNSLIYVLTEKSSTELLNLVTEDQAHNTSQLKAEKVNLETLLEQYRTKVESLNLPAAILVDNLVTSDEQYMINLDNETTQALAKLSAAEFRELNDLSTKIKATQSVYKEYLTKERQLSEIEKILETDNKLIATVSEPIAEENQVSPKPVLNMGIGIVLGLMLGIGIVFFRHYWQETKGN